MSGAIAGIGIRAILGHAASRVGSGAASAAKGVFGWLRSLSVWQLLLIAAVAFAGFQHFFQLVPARHALTACETKSKAAADALVTSRANEILLRGQLADQNKRVNALAKQSADQQQALAQALQKGAGRRAGARAVSQALAAAARQKPPPAVPGAPCEAPDDVKGQWK
jgi:hypothetical protein